MKETIKNNLRIKIIIDINLKILKEKINHKIYNKKYLNIKQKLKINYLIKN